MSYQELIKEDQGESLEKAIIAYQHALEVYTREDFPLQWATIQNNLGTVYQERIKGDREKNLEMAIIAYQQALNVYTCEDFPLQWAEIQNNLGNVYQESQEFKKPISSARNNETTAAETLEELPSIILEEKSKSENTNTSIINQPINDKNIIWKRSNQILALASGGAFLGGIIAQIPGSIIGAVIAAIYGIMIKEKTN